MPETFIVIPSLNPDEKFLRLLDSLLAAGFRRILVVNDGSREDCTAYFSAAREKGAVVLSHAVNQGKGRALKTAFHYLLNTFGDDVFAVCADGDGQHTAGDIRAVEAALSARPEALVLGCRDFSQKSVPFKSRWGNRITRGAFHLLCGVRVSDTQTGLRGLSGKSMRAFLSTEGERFEYEMNMLMEAKQKDIPLAEVPIATIYIEENRSSHFHPLRDSLRICRVFAAFLASSLLASGLDLLLFWGFTWIFSFLAQRWEILLSTFLARAVSSLVNYGVNKSRVFHAKARGALWKYYLLCVVQLLCSAGLVDLLCGLTHGPEVLLKIPVDLVLFLLSFQIQRIWVFREKNT